MGAFIINHCKSLMSTCISLNCWFIHKSCPSNRRSWPSVCNAMKCAMYVMSLSLNVYSNWFCSVYTHQSWPCTIHKIILFLFQFHLEATANIGNIFYNQPMRKENIPNQAYWYHISLTTIFHISDEHTHWLGRDLLITGREILLTVFIDRSGIT